MRRRRRDTIGPIVLASSETIGSQLRQGLSCFSGAIIDSPRPGNSYLPGIFVFPDSFCCTLATLIGERRVKREFSTTFRAGRHEVNCGPNQHAQSNNGAISKLWAELPRRLSGSLCDFTRNSLIQRLLSAFNSRFRKNLRFPARKRVEL